MHTYKRKRAFTLVELIVVIVILAILATIAFLSFSNYSSGARDSTRLSDLSNIAKWFTVNQAVWWKYPVPDKKVPIFSSSWVLIWYQWEAWTSTLNMIKFSAWWWKDPLDNVYYTYSSNATQNKYQLITFLENNFVAHDFNPFSADKINATDYSNRYPYERWNQLWIILSKTTSASWSVSYTPLQDIPSFQASSEWFIISDSTINTWMVAIVSRSSPPSAVTVGALSAFTSPENPVPTTEITSWDQIKSDTDIYKLSNSWSVFIFGTWSFYTQNWASNSCNPDNISVITKSDFSSAYVIPANTIVKVPNWNYNLDWNTSSVGHISFAWNCSALIWESANWVRFNGLTTWWWNVSGRWVIWITWWNNIALNMTISWNKSNTTNNYGDSLSLLGDNSTLKNIVVYDAIRDWILVSWVNDTLVNLIAYNNWNGIGFFWISVGGNHNYLNNIQSFNNFEWIKIQWQNGTYNNMLIYNNGNHGLYMTNIQNSTVYNIETSGNGNVWFNVQNSTSSNNVLSSIQSFHNSYWLQSFWWTESTYYWQAKIYSCWSDCSTSSLPAWTDWLMWWANWTNVNTWAIDCSNHAQPQWWFDWSVLAWTVGNYTYTWFGCSTIWTVNFTALPIAGYTFGSNLANQTRPVICPAWSSCPDWTNLQYFWASWNDYFPSKKIWEW
ncbi:MAG: hypothetical protein ACD_2C00217G0002 [uncultured bacterium (gcode 4)]|uniref:Prepilin-type N-terminal cleavage/methylation domain-containing protein n=1 Tax=uncultured bacterium (gcode 4) TaxID=1234023 RepID=K2H088_9BACT|nr:MAG: hypothetical protein ACD_2C00217G0002 [uncultured bacterium (gcode 4)]